MTSACDHSRTFTIKDNKTEARSSDRVTEQKKSIETTKPHDRPVSTWSGDSDKRPGDPKRVKGPLLGPVWILQKIMQYVRTLLELTRLIHCSLIYKFKHVIEKNIKTRTRELLRLLTLQVQCKEQVPATSDKYLGHPPVSSSTKKRSRRSSGTEWSTMYIRLQHAVQRRRYTEARQGVTNCVYWRRKFDDRSFCFPTINRCRRNVIIQYWQTLNANFPRQWRGAETQVCLTQGLHSFKEENGDAIPTEQLQQKS